MTFYEMKCIYSNLNVPFFKTKYKKHNFRKFA
jgi:hypothetical protein